MYEEEQRPFMLLVSLMRKHRFAMLLFVLFLLFFYGSFVELFVPRLKPVVARVTIGSVITALLMAAVFTVSKSQRTLQVSIWLAVPAILFEILDVWLFRTETQVASHVLGAVFLVYVILILLKFIFLSHSVTVNTICASLCVYLLIGTVWAMVYSMLEMFQPNAFSYSVASMETASPMRLGAVPAGLEFYYSFVTMTTLGYGDIVPVSSAARALATLQAVIGQLYLTVLVARLVGMHVAESAGKKGRR